jgi:phosphorylcholine metabolism protein LicD
MKTCLKKILKFISELCDELNVDYHNSNWTFIDTQRKS